MRKEYPPFFGARLNYWEAVKSTRRQHPTDTGLRQYILGEESR